MAWRALAREPSSRAVENVMLGQGQGEPVFLWPTDGRADPRIIDVEIAIRGSTLPSVGSLYEKSLEDSVT